MARVLCTRNIGQVGTSKYSLFRTRLSNYLHIKRILAFQYLQYFNETPLHVAGFGGFDCSVDEALAAAHRVEEELVRTEASEERVLHEALGIRRLIYKHRIEYTTSWIEYHCDKWNTGRRASKLN